MCTGEGVSNEVSVQKPPIAARIVLYHRYQATEEDVFLKDLKSPHLILDLNQLWISTMNLVG